jgi:beta-N-acetylhexosaminidase
MASEVRASGVDLSFAPVVDLGRGNRAIGDRAFSADPAGGGRVHRAYVRGMHEAAWPPRSSISPATAPCWKIPTSTTRRPAPAGRAAREDLLPFAAGIAAGADAVMMAHVSYPAVAPEPAGYSPRWINEILRGEMGFRGVVFSDDIGMAASHSAGGVRGRVLAHLDAGCDVVLVCHPELVEESLHAVRGRALNTAALPA